MSARPWITIFVGLLLVLALPRAGFASCTVSPSTLAFGSFNPVLAKPLKTTASITMTCTRNSGTAQVVVQLGDGDSGSYLTRAMRGSKGNLSYQLYSDPAYTQVWPSPKCAGCGVNEATTVNSTGGSVTWTVYGEIFAQKAIPGSYTDTITVTVTF